MLLLQENKLIKAGSHCDISISINISIRIASVNRRNISISISIRKWKMFHFLMLMLMLLCCVCEPPCTSINISISMSAVFPSAEKHESRVQSRSKTQKMAAEFEEKPAEAVRKYTSLYNSLPTSKINPREFFHKMIFVNAYISLSWCWYFPCFSVSSS